MTRRTRRIAAGLAGLALLAGVAVAVGPISRPHPCMATFRMVRAGMSLPEVEAMVGASPVVQQRLELGPTMCIWEADDGTDDTLSTLFDSATGTTASVHITPGASPSLLARIRRWLGF